jgi:hypothetical protein
LNTFQIRRLLLMIVAVSFVLLMRQDVYSQTIEIEGAASNIDDNKLSLRFKEFPKEGKLAIPRLYNPIRQIYWQSEKADAPRVPLSVDVLPTRWILKCEAIPNSSVNGHIVVEVEGRLQSQMGQAISAHADGGFTLPACLGITLGTMLRYEPQPHKNTVGYWTQASDRVRWPIQVDRAGEFNIGVLQGCGAGQGGSKAEFRLVGPVDPKIAFDSTVPGKAIDSAAFEVLDTGHFQNFQWRHIGSVKVAEPGLYFAEVVPVQIAKNALMDIRCIQLNRNP